MFSKRQGVCILTGAFILKLKASKSMLYVPGFRFVAINSMFLFINCGFGFADAEILLSAHAGAGGSVGVGVIVGIGVFVGGIGVGVEIGAAFDIAKET